MHIGHDVPGGNLILDAVTVEGDVVRVVVRPDLRDTVGHWFWWAFEVRGMGGRRLQVRFAVPFCLTARGPVVSGDGGRSWRYVEPHADGNGFEMVLPDDGAHRFAMAIPYTQLDWDAFMGTLRGRAGVEAGVLCTSAGGRAVELLQLGAADAGMKVTVTCRHHACESMASFVLEGFVEGWLDDPRCGWLREHAGALIVPFVDKDGVEQGDQGKNRGGHDHNQDYVEGRYAEVAAIRERFPAWAGEAWRVALDLHCPWIRDVYNEHIYIVNSADPALAARNEAFARVLEAEDDSGLGYAAAGTLAHGVAWNTRPADAPRTSHSRWAAGHAGVRVCCGLEVPYAVTPGGEVTVGKARAFGRALARAVGGWGEK